MTKQFISILTAAGLTAAGGSLLAQQTRSVFYHAAGPGAMSAEPMRVAPMKGAPYSADAITESVQVLADGNRIVNRQTASVARDSQGRTRNEANLQPIGPASGEAQGLKIVMLHDPVGQVTYTLDTATKTARKVSTAGLFEAKVKAEAGQAKVIERQIRVSGDVGSELQAKRKAEERQLVIEGMNVMSVRTMRTSSSQAKSESLGTQVIEGVLADGTRTTETIPVNEIGNEKELQIVNEVWVAQDLKAVVLSKRSDPRTGEVTFKLANIKRSEPSPALFEVPAEYQIVDEPSKGVFFYKNNE